MRYDSTDLMSVVLLDPARFLGILGEDRVDLREEALSCVIVESTNNGSALDEPK